MPPDPESLRPVTTGAARAAVVATIAMWHRAEVTARANLNDTVQLARGFGATWQEIGQAIGVSRQYAQRRFGTPEEMRDSFVDDDAATRRDRRLPPE